MKQQAARPKKIHVGGTCALERTGIRAENWASGDEILRMQDNSESKMRTERLADQNQNEILSVIEENKTRA
jgi:hypothetical protein